MRKSSHQCLHRQTEKWGYIWYSGPVEANSLTRQLVQFGSNSLYNIRKVCWLLFRLYNSNMTFSPWLVSGFIYGLQYIYSYYSKDISLYTFDCVSMSDALLPLCVMEQDVCMWRVRLIFNWAFTWFTLKEGRTQCKTCLMTLVTLYNNGQLMHH